MENEALMRRIATATEAQNARLAGERNGISATANARPAISVSTAPRPAPSVATLSPQTRTIAPAPQVVSERRAVPQNIAEQLPSGAVAQPAPVHAAPVAAPRPISADTMSFRPTFDPKAPAQQEQEASEAALPLGNLASCDGVNAIIQTTADSNAEDVAVGQMIVMKVDDSQIIGLVFKLEQVMVSNQNTPALQIHVELQGEIRRRENGTPKFNKGIARYPKIGTPAQRIMSSELAAIYAVNGSRNAIIGCLAQEETIPAYIDVESMLSKHFAVLGSTGCGKSSAVSLLLRAAHEVVPDLRTLILDPHNEYSSAFPEANTIAPESLDIPFWLFQLEEYAEVLFRGKPVNVDEIDALRDFIPEAKQRYRDGEERTSLRTGAVSGALTSDTPVPYRISDVLAVIDEELGLLEPRFSRTILKSLKSRISAHCNDARYRFMFRDRTIFDRAEETLDTFFNLKGEGSLLTILQTSGLPSEVVDAVASVLCRLSFELCIAAQGKLKLLVVCEEAHRYVPSDESAGFEPTRRAIARIAKEGRKYGAFIAIISQRPAELDPTILSQCSTVFSLRMSNENDQILIRKAISSSSKSTVSFLSSLANREAIAFGEGFSTPMRLRFRTLPEQWLPGRDRNVFQSEVDVNAIPQARQVFHNWRGVVGLMPSPRPIA